MSETIEEWLAKAQGDFNIAQRELRARVSPNYDGVCFHCQQCVEKLMKALLIQLRVVPPKIHDLVRLNELLVPVCPGWVWAVDELRMVSHSGVLARYPGESATKEDAKEVFGLTRAMRSTLLHLLGRDEPPPLFKR